MADFQSRVDELEGSGISLYAVSTDDEAHAREMVDKHGLTFPVLYGIDGPRTAEAWGAYYEPKRNILHATSYVLLPDHTIGHASYSTGPAARLWAEDALGLVGVYRKRG